MRGVCVEERGWRLAACVKPQDGLGPVISADNPREEVNGVSAGLRAAAAFHHSFFSFLSVNSQSFMLRASPLMHILGLLLTPELQGGSIYSSHCYVLSPHPAL